MGSRVERAFGLLREMWYAPVAEVMAWVECLVGGYMERVTLYPPRPTRWPPAEQQPFQPTVRDAIGHLIGLTAAF